jgi:hypothetical protein
MANNQKKLKAFVRYDGSGRVVASSLILRKNKPRVGRWYEIPEYLCCNETTNTTTTQGGGVTPTAWVGNTSFTLQGACAGGGLTYIFYTSTSTLGIGTALWNNAALTVPFNNGVLTQPWINVNGNVYQLGSQGNNVVITGQGTCVTTTTSTTAAPLECLAYNVSVPDGGSGTLTWTDCNGNNFGPQTFTGPFSSDGYCFVSSSTTGALTVTSLGPCR